MNLAIRIAGALVKVTLSTLGMVLVSAPTRHIAGALVGAVTSTLGAVLVSVPNRLMRESVYFYQEYIKEMYLRMVRRGNGNADLYIGYGPYPYDDQVEPLSLQEKIELGINLIIVGIVFVVPITALYLAAELIYTAAVSLATILVAPFYGFWTGLTEGLAAGFISPLKLFEDVINPIMVLPEAFQEFRDWLVIRMQEGVFPPRSNRLQKSNEELLTDIQSEMNKNSEPAPAWLTANEMDQYQQLTESAEGAPLSDEQKRNKKNLADYQAYVARRCAISLTEVTEMEAPITFEAGYGNRSWTRTFEASDLSGHINSCTAQHKPAFAPESKDDHLNDADHVSYYKGFSKTIKNFIQEVRARIKKMPDPSVLEEKAMQPRRLFLDKHSVLFAYAEPQSEEDALEFEPGSEVAPASPLPAKSALGEGIKVKTNTSPTH